MFIQWRWVQGFDINAGGVLFGGRMLSWVDEDCTMCATLASPPGTHWTTLGMEKVRFHSPVLQGQRLYFEYIPVHKGRTSLTIHIKVYKSDKERHIGDLAFSCFTTVVCVENGKPTKMPESVEVPRNELWDYVEQLRKER